MVKRASDVTSEILATGEATLSQIAQMFNTDAKTLPARMKGVVPAGKRNGYKVYNIREAAGRLVTPSYEIEQFIKQMSPQELPPLLNKEFWNGQRARIAYEKEMGNLWPTEDVVELFGVLEQGVRQTWILLTDDVEREESVTDGQRKVLRRISDAAITTFKNKLVEKFKDYYANRADDRGPDGAKRLVDSRGDGRRVPEAEEDEEVDI
jgi:hypothetical protein